MTCPNAVRVALPSCLVLALAAASGLADGERPVGVLLGHRDKVTTQLEPGDTDAFAIVLCEGDQLTFSCKANPKGDLLPVLTAYRPDGRQVDLGDYLRKEGTRSPSIKRLPAEAGHSGTWKIVVASDPPGSGPYAVKVKIKRAKPPKHKALEVPAGETVRVPVPAFDGMVLGVKVKERSGPALASIRLLDPSDGVVAGPSAFERKKAKLTAKGISLAGGLGVYVLELEGGGPDPTVVSVKIRKKLPKVTPRKGSLHPEASVTAAKPLYVKQGTTGNEVMLEGWNFLAGTEMEIEASGVELRSYEIVSENEIRLTVDVALDAALGPQQILLYPPPEIEEPFQASVLVYAPDPSIHALFGSPVRQGDRNVRIEIEGENFCSGGTILIEGDGFWHGGTVVQGSTRAWLYVDFDRDAEPVPRDVSFKQPEIGGGAITTLSQSLVIHYPLPVIEYVSRILLRPGETDVQLTLAGSGFRPGMEVACGEGVTVSGSTSVSDEEHRITVSVAQDALPGGRPITLTQAADRGGAVGGAERGFVVTQGVKLIADDGAKSDQFGYWVAAAGDRVFVSAVSDDNSRGAVYVFGSGATGWEQKAKLVPDDAAAVDLFGTCQAAEGDTLAVGAVGADVTYAGEGAVYVFEQDAGTWTQEAKLVASDPSVSAQFGRSLALDGDTLVIGADRALRDSEKTGALYVFERVAGTWEQTGKIQPEDLADGDQFGFSVALDGDRLLVGAPGADGFAADSGAVYVFERNQGVWQEDEKLPPQDEKYRDLFGFSVALEGDVAVVGRRDGNAAHVYQKLYDWTMMQKLTPGQDGVIFGRCTGIHSGKIVVTDPYDPATTTEQGSAHVFARKGTEWLEVGLVTAEDDDTVQGYEYGLSCFVGPRLLVVGAPRYDGKEEQSGAAFLYELP